MFTSASNPSSGTGPPRRDGHNSGGGGKGTLRRWWRSWEGRQKKLARERRREDDNLPGRIRRVVWILLVLLMIMGPPLAIDQIIGSVAYREGVVFYQVHNTRERTVGIVLGAAVWRGKPSPILRDRLDATIQLYQNNKIKKVLVTGDHRKDNYNEVGAMTRYLIKRGVRRPDIFMDHAGLSTFDSLQRAARKFHINDALIVTQEFHLPRALYLARSFDIEALGFVADKRVYRDQVYNRGRELLARVKAWLDVNFDLRPHPAVGKVYPITGDGQATWEKEN